MYTARKVVPRYNSWDKKKQKQKQKQNQPTKEEETGESLACRESGDVEEEEMTFKTETKKPLGLNAGKDGNSET